MYAKPPKRLCQIKTVDNKNTLQKNQMHCNVITFQAKLPKQVNQPFPSKFPELYRLCTKICLRRVERLKNVVFDSQKFFKDFWCSGNLNLLKKASAENRTRDLVLFKCLREVSIPQKGNFPEIQKISHFLCQETIGFLGIPRTRSNQLSYWGIRKEKAIPIKTYLTWKNATPSRNPCKKPSQSSQ